MGILSWFRGKAEQVRREQYARAHPIREDHYGFAHFKLRQFAQHAPELVHSALDSKSPEKFLTDAWRLAPEGQTFQASNPDLNPGQLKVHPATVGPYLAKVVEMQPTTAPGEAELIAIVWRVLPPKAAKEKPRTFDPVVLYYTLEHPATELAPYDLCQWVGDDHKALGITLPSLDRDAFIATVVDQVRAHEKAEGKGVFAERDL